MAIPRSNNGASRRNNRPARLSSFSGARGDGTESLAAVERSGVVGFTITFTIDWASYGKYT